MNTKLHTSLQSSKLIHSVLPELESEMWWQHTQGRGNDSIVSETKDSEYFIYFPALSLTDLLQAIELICKKKQCCNGDVRKPKCAICGGWSGKPDPDKHSHQLLDIYLRTKDLSCKEVDEWVKNTFTSNK